MRWFMICLWHMIDSHNILKISHHVQGKITALVKETKCLDLTIILIHNQKYICNVTNCKCDAICKHLLR